MPSFTTPVGDFDKYIPNQNPWRFGWLNSADMNFNFNKLLDNAKSSAIGKAPETPPKTAIIGAGVAGMTAARELFRSGYTNIDIFEATDRVGGRDYSVLPTNAGKSDEINSVFELGAMRLPFFPDPQTPNSAMGFYAGSHGITTQAFPGPGVVTTGIYVHDGFGPNASQPSPDPETLIWERGSGAPPTQELAAIYQSWSAFANLVKQQLLSVYVKDDDSWVDLWHNIANNYSHLNFRQLAQLPAISEYEPSTPGYFGGLGFSNEQLQIFYLIGAGDGSWGAFFDVGSLYIFRTLLCGFGVNHQLINGRYNGDTFNPGPYVDAGTVPVSDGGKIKAPVYRGVQSFAECMFFLPADDAKSSVYDAVAGNVPGANVNLYSETSVTALSGGDDTTTTTLTYQTKGGSAKTATYDHVILTPTTWASQISINITEFSDKRLPFNIRSAMSTSHWIKSCKICVAAKSKYWENGASKIPQVLVTDTFLQDVYAYSADEDTGVVILSYTWEDDASKFLSYGDADLIQKCIDESDRILMRSTNIQEKISTYLDLEEARVIHWALEPSYHGCANLYRPGRWIQDYDLLAFNQTFSEKSGLYFAGEAYSVEGGWTEPAIRSGLDAVMHIVKNSGGEFLNGFDFASDYLVLDTNFKPTPPSTMRAN